MKKTKIITTVTVVCFVMIWALPFIKNEILTLLYGNNFIGLHKTANMISGDVDYLKVLAYSNKSARVYYVGGVGAILGFTKNNGEWEMVNWNVIWSRTGSADDFIWPYFYHSPEGIYFFIVTIIPLIIVISVCLLIIKSRLAKQSK